jgi:hypothetical protein
VIKQWLNSDHHPIALHVHHETIQRRLPLPNDRLCDLDNGRSRRRNNSWLHCNIGSSNASSGKWWSKKKSSIFSSSMQPLDRLRPQNERGVTKTTITGGRASEESDKKLFLDAGATPSQWQNGISKSVSTTVVEERRDDHQLAPVSANQMNSRRAGSPGGESDSSFPDERGKPAIVHARF